MLEKSSEGKVKKSELSALLIKIESTQHRLYRQTDKNRE